jgi:transcriptional regulator with XRE-family HTH domain
MESLDMAKSRPYADTPLTEFIVRRVLELRPKKSQIEIATEAGFVNPNMLSLIKSGATKVPLDRVPALARALEVDPPASVSDGIRAGRRRETMRRAVEEVFGTVVTRNEVSWIEEIRDASGHTDPALTSRARASIRGFSGSDRQARH